jgi:hypothetical protein
MKYNIMKILLLMLVFLTSAAYGKKAVKIELIKADWIFGGGSYITEGGGSKTLYKYTIPVKKMAISNNQQQCLSYYYKGPDYFTCTIGRFLYDDSYHFNSLTLDISNYKEGIQNEVKNHLYSFMYTWEKNIGNIKTTKVQLKIRYKCIYEDDTTILKTDRYDHTNITNYMQFLSAKCCDLEWF